MIFLGSWMLICNETYTVFVETKSCFIGCNFYLGRFCSMRLFRLVFSGFSDLYGDDFDPSISSAFSKSYKESNGTKSMVICCTFSPNFPKAILIKTGTNSQLIRCNFCRWRFSSAFLKATINQPGQNFG